MKVKQQSLYTKPNAIPPWTKFNVMKGAISGSIFKEHRWPVLTQYDGITDQMLSSSFFRML
jgi:hypothetical protein